MSDNESTIYQQRVSTGAYARLMDNIKAIKSRALVFSEYKRDFYQDSKRGFMTHRSDGDPTPFKMWLFGEIASRAVGTLHQASGNHYLGKRPPYELIDDDTRVKDVFMLKVPTDAPPDLAHLYDYQLTVLNSIRLDDEEIEADSGQTNIDALEWVRHSNPAEAPNLICVYMGSKYEVPQDPNAKTTSPSRKRARTAKNSGRVMVAAPQKAAPSTNAVAEQSPPIVPDPKDIEMGKFYDPRLLEDYGGPIFAHKQAKLVQRHISDPSGTLIPPWKEYDHLRTGTVVLIRVSLRVYAVPNGPKTRKLYQIYADRIRIVLPSDEPVDVRSIKLLDVQGHERKHEDQDSDDEMLKCFNNAAEPVKKLSLTTQSIGGPSTSGPTTAESAKMKWSSSSSWPAAPLGEHKVDSSEKKSRSSPRGKKETKEANMVIDE